MGSKRSGAARAGRKAVTRRAQKRANMTSLAPAPRTSGPSATVVERSAATGASAITPLPIAQQAEEPSPLATPPPAPEPLETASPSSGVTAPTSNGEAVAEECAGQSGPDTQPLSVAPAGGRRRYPTLARMASISLRNALPISQARAGEGPVPAVADLPKSTAADDSPGAPLRGHAVMSGPRPRRTRAGRPQPLPRSNVVLVVVGVHAALAVAAALVGAALVLAGSPAWIWALLLAVIAGAGGWVAYVGVQVRRWRRLGPAALVCSHVGLLAWSLAIVGPHLSLLLLVPGGAFLALRISGRTAAVCLVCAACVVFVADIVLSLMSGLAPVASLNTPLDTILDASSSATGLALALAGAFDATAGRARAELLARARQGEARRLQACIDRLRRQAEDDAAALYRALDAAREGRPLDFPIVDGVFSPVVGGIAAVGQHVADLHDEVSAGNKMEAALGQLTLALERSWLGLTWSWPSPTGTPVDDVVALLRTPSPRQLAPLLADDQPTGPIPVPTDPEMPARRRVIPAPRSNPHLDRLSLHGADQQPGATQAHAYPERRPADRRTSPLRWQDWDDWRGWQAD